MLVPQQAADDVANVAADDVDDVAAEDVAPTPPPSTIAPPSSPPQQQQPSKPTTEVREEEKVKSLWVKKIEEGGIIADLNADKDVTLEEVDAAKDAEDDESEPAKLKEVIDVVTTAKLMTKVVTATVTTAASTITADPSATRRRKELEEEESRTLKRQSKSSKEKAAKKQKLDEEVEELRKHLQIMPNNDDDVYTEATPVALKVRVVDYEIHSENNKSYYKIIRADGSHQLFLNLLSLLRNFDREDLEMLNSVRLEVEEENEVSLELLRFVRRQQQEGYRPENFGVDAAEDFKQYTIRDYYYWLKTYNCWCKLMLLDDAADSREINDLNFLSFKESSISLYWTESARRIPEKVDIRDYWIGISSAGDFLGTAPFYTFIRDPMMRLCHRLITFSIAGRSQAPKKGAMISEGQYVARLAKHFGLLTEERIQGLTVIAPVLPIIDMAKLEGDAKGVTKEAAVAPRGGDEDKEMPEAVLPPPRTQGERIARFTTWIITSLIRMMDKAGVPYMRYLESPIEYERRTRRRTDEPSTSPAPQH
nr:hypothetical protein [Tanacetum cinerariifolium]